MRQGWLDGGRTGVAQLADLHTGCAHHLPALRLRTHWPQRAYHVELVRYSRLTMVVGWRRVAEDGLDRLVLGRRWLDSSATGRMLMGLGAWQAPTVVGRCGATAQRTQLKVNDQHSARALRCWRSSCARAPAGAVAASRQSLASRWPFQVATPAATSVCPMRRQSSTSTWADRLPLAVGLPIAWRVRAVWRENALRQCPAQQTRPVRQWMQSAIQIERFACPAWSTRTA